MASDCTLTDDSDGSDLEDESQSEGSQSPESLKVIALSGEVVQEVDPRFLPEQGFALELARSVGRAITLPGCRLRFSLEGRLLSSADSWRSLGQPAELQLVTLPACNDFEDELLQAVAIQDAAGVCGFIDRLQDPNVCYKDGSSAFMRASALGDLAVLGALHAAGADVNGCDRAGATALHLAARMVRLETLRFLLSLRVDVNKLDLAGRTVLHEAVSTGCSSLVQALVDAGANQEQAVEGVTPLCLAASEGHDEVVRILLRAGVRIGAGPLHAAASHDKHEVLAALLAYDARVNSVDQDGTTALLLAARSGHLRAVQVLLGGGAAQTPDRHGVTPLHAAAAGRPWRRVAKGPTPASPSKSFVVRRSGDHGRVVECLIAATAHVNARDESGATALHAAASNGKSEIVRLLLASNACNLDDDTGATPFCKATSNGHRDVMDIMLGAGMF